MNNKRFIFGFNSGYLMAKYCSELCGVLVKGIGNSFDFLNGFKAGRSEFEQERSQELLNTFNTIRKDSSRQNDLER